MYFENFYFSLSHFLFLSNACTIISKFVDFFKKIQKEVVYYFRMFLVRDFVEIGNVLPLCTCFFFYLDESNESKILFKKSVLVKCVYQHLHNLLVIIVLHCQTLWYKWDTSICNSNYLRCKWKKLQLWWRQYNINHIHGTNCFVWVTISFFT